LASALLLGGCAVGPDYSPPETSTPAKWSQDLADTFSDDAGQIQAWWQIFEDPILEDLIIQAGSSNLNLKIAAARIEEAQALRNIARSGYAPQVQAEAAAQYTRTSEATNPFLPPSVERESGFYSVGASAAWELDVWGRVKRSVESATASLEASEEDYRDTLVILYGQVATTYVEARTLQQRIRYAQQNAEAQRETLQLTQNLNSAGLVGDLDVSQAQLNLARTESAIPNFQAGLTATINQLAVLLGQTPGALQSLIETEQPIPSPPDVVAVGLPVDLLRQRPDLRRAERLLAAQTALIGVAQADLYPALSLPGTLSFEALDPGNLNGSSLAYAFGPTLRWNLFSGGRIRSQIKVEEIRTEQALLAYEQTVLLALAEVENNMASFAKEQDRLTMVTDARNAARRSVELVKELYRSGLTHFQNVLDMERSLATEEDNLAASRGFLANDVVALYRALGGGWQLNSTDPFEVTSASAVGPAESHP
jgi:NodT family efflux transporter outer membrane factor (OMF) lipoprotein